MFIFFKAQRYTYGPKVIIFIASVSAKRIRKKNIHIYLLRAPLEAFHILFTTNIGCVYNRQTTESFFGHVARHIFRSKDALCENLACLPDGLPPCCGNSEINSSSFYGK